VPPAARRDAEALLPRRGLTTSITNDSTS
jgi:hypothetical protein